MKIAIWVLSSVLLLTQCQKDELLVTEAGVLNQEFEIALHQKVRLKSNNSTEAPDLGTIEFTNLDESRCPANAMCIRQGAAVTSFQITSTTSNETQTVRMFVGDFMNNDPRNKRNQSADTTIVQLNNNARYQLILKQVMPYPGTSDDTPKATLELKAE